MTTSAQTIDPRRQAEDFLRVADRYRLGVLPTEQPHPRTRELSGWARRDPARGVAELKRVDLDALATMQRYAVRIDRLARRVRRTIESGRRVYLCGCGATGRLSLSLEFLWRRTHEGDDSVRSFMAGGDVALVHALEGFEDHPAHGARHLEQTGFAEGDLLIACTEGGETPWVIGAAERAAHLSSNAPAFLYCNPDAVLVRHVERFRRVFQNPGIEKLCLDVGPMALAGSTRMQASTVLQLAVGLALLRPGTPAGAAIAQLARRLERTDLSFLAPLIEKESGLIAAGDHVTYTTRDYGITVLTDTTERAPTFSLVPFDQLEEARPAYSLCYLSLDDAGDPDEAWLRLLGRAPRPIDWPEVDPRTGSQYLLGFDFSIRARERRRRQIPGRTHHELSIRDEDGAIAFRLDGLRHEVSVRDMDDLSRHLLLKMILNTHSTLVMGRLDRYEGNLMTWVTPTNNKLIDRAARYVLHLLARDGRTEPGYEQAVRQLFVEMERTAPGESVVLRAFETMRPRRAAS